MASHTNVARFRRRLVAGILGVACVAIGVVVGCGIDVAGTFDEAPRTGDAADALGPKLPGEGGSDGPIATDGGVDAPADGPVSPCELSACADAGGYCDDGGINACTFDCAGAKPCADGVTCPPGVACKVACLSNGSCGGRIDCSKASSCDIACLGDGTCKGVDCAGSRCDVVCKGQDSCRDDVDGSVTCRAAICNIGCDGGGSNTCGDPVFCQSARCAVSCAANTCDEGVTVMGGDASVHCGNNACGDEGARCIGTTKCQLGCGGGTCATRLCCDGGVCLFDGGNGDDCP